MVPGGPENKIILMGRYEDCNHLFILTDPRASQYFTCDVCGQKEEKMTWELALPVSCLIRLEGKHSDYYQLAWIPNYVSLKNDESALRKLSRKEWIHKDLMKPSIDYQRDLLSRLCGEVLVDTEQNGLYMKVTSEIIDRPIP